MVMVRYYSLMPIIKISWKPISWDIKIVKRTNMYWHFLCPNLGIYIHFPNLQNNYGRRFNFPHFTNEETEAQRGWVCLPRSNREWVAGWGLNQVTYPPASALSATSVNPASFKNENQPSEYTRQCYFSGTESMWMLIRPLFSLLIDY